VLQLLAADKAAQSRVHGVVGRDGGAPLALATVWSGSAALGNDSLQQVLGLQRLAGNAAVAGWLAAYRSRADLGYGSGRPSPRPSVQRCGGEVHQGCACAEEAAPVQRTAAQFPPSASIPASHWSSAVGFTLPVAGPRRSATLPVQRVRCGLVPAATCSAPIAGSASDFSGSEAAVEAGPRARRAAMPAARQTSTGRTGRGKQLELFLEAESPGLLANVHGIFLDRDMSPGTGAITMPCADMVPPILGAAKPCVFIPPTLNREALRFRQGRATVGGRPRATWRIDTLQTLFHEIQHVKFDTAGLPVPGGAAGCPRSSVDFELSELNAITSEFPPVFDAVPAGAAAADPAKQRLDAWFQNAIQNPSEGIKGILDTMRCACDCGDVDAYIAQTVTFATSGWPAPRLAALNAELRKPVWGLNWPL
jgi:hypothetical protein